MLEALERLLAEAQQQIDACSSAKDLSELETKLFAKKGELSRILGGLGALPAEERPIVGAAANKARDQLRTLIEARKMELGGKRALGAHPDFDFTLPGRYRRYGSQHPLTAVQQEIDQVFIGLGFEVVEGPEIETEYYNFIALNIPPHHPIRDAHDSFYLTDEVLLRTETSAVQIRTMERREPPVRVVSPGRVFRRDAVDATHSHTFHQLEGLYVDENVTFADLKGTLRLLIDSLYGPGLKMRFRPDYFPFVEPGAEVAFECPASLRERLLKTTGRAPEWLELGGCGMVHPNVLKGVGYDPEKYTGYAFGLGLERVVMQKYGITDIRLFLQGDWRFTKQF
jgi:phenylalanyl-tRNA synthetase alpha chain